MGKNLLIHGGDVTGFKEEFGFEPLDFSANISPLGMPEGVKNAVLEACNNAEAYPDPLCRELCRAISDFENVSERYCMCGNGAADLIFRLVLALKPKKALITAPAFSEYELALNTVGCKVNKYLLSENKEFHLDEGFEQCIDDETDIVFLCQPNNPTGIADSRKLLESIREKCWKVGAFLVMDECFNDFLDSPEEHTMKKHIENNKNMLILKSFTKMYAMAGVRLGYCLCSDEDLLDTMKECGQPWAVSSIAQAAGVAALKEKEYVKNVRSLIFEERNWIENQMRGLGLHVISGMANYLLFKADKELGTKMKKRGILLRSCGNYDGLDNCWYRTAVRTHKENKRLIAMLEAVL